jgi:hypothetical protein
VVQEKDDDQAAPQPEESTLDAWAWVARARAAAARARLDTEQTPQAPSQSPDDETPSARGG